LPDGHTEHDGDTICDKDSRDEIHEMNNRIQFIRP